MLRAMLFALSAILSFLLSGCLTPRSLSDQALAFNEADAEASDAQLLLNIVRAAYRNPTHYMSISQLRDSRTVQAQAGVAGNFPFGADALRSFGLMPDLSTSGNISPSFDVDPLDTKEAANGLYRPIDPSTFMVFWHQGWPRELLVALLVDQVSYNEAAARLCGIRDEQGIKKDVLDIVADVEAERWEKVRRVSKCLNDFLRVEEKVKSDVLVASAILKPEEAIKQLPALTEKGLQMREDGTGATRRYTVSKGARDFELSLALRGGVDGRAGLSLGTTNLPEGDDAKPRIGVAFRSVDGIVYFLGEVVRRQLQHGTPLRIPMGKANPAIFKVLRNSPSVRDAISVRFLGETFSVDRHPRDDDRSLTTLSLLTQVFALNRKDADRPKTTAVEIVGGR